MSSSAKCKPSAAEITAIIQLLSSPNPAIRFRLTRFLSEFAQHDICFVFNSFYRPVIVEATQKIDDHYARAGAVELIFGLTQHLEIDKLISVSSLLAPKALILISDSIESIRDLAARSFGKLISLLHIQHVSSEVFIHPTTYVLCARFSPNMFPN